MKTENSVETRVKLSILWLVLMLNMIYADIFSIIVELVNKNTLDLPGEVKTIMAIAAIITNIPIFMIFLARVLPHRYNRPVNIIAAIITLIYIIGGGDTTPHYIIIAGIETIILLYIIVIAWKWKKADS